MALRSVSVVLLWLIAPCSAGTGRGLLIIDVQDCFIEGGSLAVKAKHIIPVINEMRKCDSKLFDIVVRSQDYHPAGHISFGSANGVGNLAAGTPIPMKCIKPGSGMTADAACCANATAAPADIQANISSKVAGMTDNLACKTCFDASTADQCFEMQQAMWPDHCLKDGDSTFPTDLTTKESDVVMQKGANPFVDAYSVFMDNTKSLKTPAEKILKDAGVTDLVVVGIATDFCVKWSATDAVDLGFKVTVITDASAGIGIPLTEGDTVSVAMKEMGDKKITMTTWPEMAKSMGCEYTEPKASPSPSGAGASGCVETFTKPGGTDYEGCQVTTHLGYHCQRWDAQTPHTHSFSKLADHSNFCRNPDGEPALWCYTTDPTHRWDYCRPNCTNPDTESHCTSIVSVITKDGSKKGLTCQWDSASSSCSVGCKDDDVGIELVSDGLATNCAVAKDFCAFPDYAKPLEEWCRITCPTKICPDNVAASKEAAAKKDAGKADATKSGTDAPATTQAPATATTAADEASNACALTVSLALLAPIGFLA